MSQDDKSGEIIDFRRSGSISDTSRDQRREAKAQDLKQRFSAARRNSESKTKAAERLRKLFKNPGRNPR